MMNANDLRIQTSNNRVKNMESRIDKAVCEGKYSCGTGYSDMWPEEIAYFEEMGFTVKTGEMHGNSWYVISWEY